MGGEVVLVALEHGHRPKGPKVAQTNASSSDGRAPPDQYPQ